MSPVPEWGWVVAGGALLGAGAAFAALEVWAIRTRRHATFTEVVHRRVGRVPFPARFAAAGAATGVAVWATLHLLFPDLQF